MTTETRGDATRRAGRGSWPIRVYRIGEEPSDDLGRITTPSERLAMMWQLALEAWEFSGRPIPDYSRAECPVRLFRRASP